MHYLNRYVIPEIQAHWEEVAYALKFTIPSVETINEKHKGDPKKCCCELLKLWLKGYGISPKIWSTLLDKISEVQDLATVRDKVLKSLATISN